MSQALVGLELVILGETLDGGGGQLAPSIRYDGITITVSLEDRHLNIVGVQGRRKILMQR